MIDRGGLVCIVSSPLPLIRRNSRAHLESCSSFGAAKYHLRLSALPDHVPQLFGMWQRARRTIHQRCGLLPPWKPAPDVPARWCSDLQPRFIGHHRGSAVKIHPIDLLVHFANVLLLISYSVSSMLWLRWFAVASALTVVPTTWRRSEFSGQRSTGRWYS